MVTSFDKLSERADNIKKYSISPWRPWYYFCYYNAASWTPDYALDAAQKLILWFKDPHKEFFQESRNKAMELVCNFLDKNFWDIKDYTIIPIPASSIIKNKIRFWKFLDVLCNKLWVENWIDYVKPFQDRPEKHKNRWHAYINFSEYVIFDNKLKWKNIIIFDDLVTGWDDMKEMWDRLEAIWWKPFLSLSLWRTNKRVLWMWNWCLIQSKYNPHIKHEKPQVEAINFDKIKELRDTDNDWKLLFEYLKEKNSRRPQSRKDNYWNDYNLEIIAREKPITTKEFEKIEEFDSKTFFDELNHMTKYVREYYEEKLKNS